jgi:cytochrome c553
LIGPAYANPGVKRHAVLRPLALRIRPGRDAPGAPCMKAYFLSTFAATVMVALVPISAASAQDAAPPTEIAEKVQLCASCHGEDGRPELHESAIIWGQQYYYLYVQLRDFAAGRRSNEIMQPIAKDMTKDEMKALAQYFSKKKWPRISFAASEADIARGRKIATAGQCPQCHLGGFVGNSRIPRLANQTITYLEKTMLDFKYKRRKNAPDIGALLESFSDDEIRAMANFLAGL